MEPPASSRGRFGTTLGQSWLIVGPSWATLGPPWRPHGPPWRFLRPCLAHLGVILAHYGPSWGQLGIIWAFLGRWTSKNFHFPQVHPLAFGFRSLEPTNRPRRESRSANNPAARRSRCRDVLNPLRNLPKRFLRGVLPAEADSGILSSWVHLLFKSGHFAWEVLKNSLLDLCYLNRVIKMQFLKTFTTQAF